MNKLSIKKLQFSGKYGTEKEERNIPQPFEVDVSVGYDFSVSMKSDNLNDTVDYKVIEKLTKDIIEGSPHKLIESLAGSIVDEVLIQTQATLAEVTLTKLKANSAGIPSIVIEKNKVAQIPDSTKDILGITKEKVMALYSPKTDGILHIKGAVYKILDNEKLKDWYQKRWQDFEKKDEKYIENNQEVAVVYNGPYEQMGAAASPQEIAFHQLFRMIRKELSLYSNVPLVEGDRLETKLIKYPVSKLGVGAHKDLSSNINAIVLFNLYGTTTFYTADDKNRSNEKAYLVEPGDIVIMRGPRNKKENDIRPIHYVLDIAEERLVFVCREIEDETEKIINKGNWMGF